MASSLQAFIGSAANGLVAGAIAPLVMDSTRELALASFGMMTIGLVAWVVLRKKWPETGRLQEALPHAGQPVRRT
jgi:DHA1 family bicyclomycin/chloramphenicol resistance-like MFS transporter